ncbi:hypothetical protein OFB94_30550, partial [Escherichia coli]|nr:hypothetical protein [Escherichia coli]
MESENWLIDGAAGKAAWVTVLPLVSPAALNAYVQSMEETLEAVLGEPAQDIEPVVYTVDAAGSFARLRDDVRQHLRGG